MNFFEFEDVWLEGAGATGARAGSSARPAGGAGARAAATRPSPGARPAGGASGTAAGRPATPPTQGARPQTTTRPQTLPHRQPGGTQPTRTPPDGKRPVPALTLDSFLSSFQQGLSTVQQGWDFARQVPGFVQQFSGPGQQPAGFTPPAPMATPPGGDGPMPGSGSPMTAPAYPLSPLADAPAPPPPSTMSPAADTGQVAQLLQALRQRQIPALPGPYATPAAAPAPAPPADAMAMLRLILSNPQFLSALQSTAASSAPRPVSLPVPVAAAAPQLRQVPIPLGAVLNAIVALAGASMTDLSAATREDEPEVPAYLVDAQGGFIVDPASADDRAALVTHFFRLSAEAQGASEGWLPVEQFEAFDDSVDEGEATEAEAWDPGF